jgi:hypothetical protein
VTASGSGAAARLLSPLTCNCPSWVTIAYQIDPSSCAASSVPTSDRMPSGHGRSVAGVRVPSGVTLVMALTSGDEVPDRSHPEPSARRSVRSVGSPLGSAGGTGDDAVSCPSASVTTKVAPIPDPESRNGKPASSRHVVPPSTPAATT